MVRKAFKEDRNQKIFDMFMAGYTLEEIGESVNLHKDTVDGRIIHLSVSLWISRVDGMNICGWMVHPLELDHLLDGNSEDGWNILDWFWFGMPECPLLDWFCRRMVFGKDGSGWNV